MKKVLLIFAALVGFVNIVYCQPRCSPGTCYREDHCYQLERKWVIWAQAVHNCHEKGGDLASVHNAFEDAFLRTQISLPNGDWNPWIGFQCRCNRGCWWSDGTTVDYNNTYDDPWNCKGDTSVYYGYMVNDPSAAHYKKWEFVLCYLDFMTYYICKYNATDAPGKRGFDASSPVSVSAFEAFKCQGMDFFVARLYRSIGAVDVKGINNVLAASAAQLTDIDGYLFPCFNKSKCPSAKSQVQDVVSALAISQATVKTLWVDVETDNWSTNTTINQKFVRDMISEIIANDYTPGIYTRDIYWNEIMGSNCTEFSNILLWWMHYNTTPTFTGFHTFGGWEAPFMKQYLDNLNNGSTQGVTIDLNYKKG